MPINLGNYGWLANIAIDYGFPVLGAALGVPALAPEAAKLVKKLLGLSANASEQTTKEAVEQADPEDLKAALESANAEAAAKWDFLARAVEAQAKVDKTSAEQINKTIREENSKGVSWWHWRHALGYLVLLYGIQQVALLTVAAFFPATLSPSDAALLFNATTIFTGGLFALLGYIAQDTSAVKVAAMTGQPVPGILSSVVKAVTPQKK